MSDVRCRACGAAVPAAAQWCSLCFADLREPVPVPVPTSEPEPEPVPVGVGAAPVAAVAPAAGPAATAAARAAAADALLGAPAAALVSADGEVGSAGEPGAEDAARAVTWPCLRCGEAVPIALDACPSCGSGFLSGASSELAVRLPVVGDIGKLSRSQRLLAGLGVSLLVMVFLVLLATIGGHVL